MLLERLPRDSATARSMGGEAAEWGLQEHLLAVVFDALQVANWQRAQRKNRPPKPTPRPGVAHGQRTGRAGGRSQDEIRAFLDNLKPREVDDDGG